MTVGNIKTITIHCNNKHAPTLENEIRCYAYMIMRIKKYLEILFFRLRLDKNLKNILEKLLKITYICLL